MVGGRAGGRESERERGREGGREGKRETGPERKIERGREGARELGAGAACVGREPEEALHPNPDFPSSNPKTDCPPSTLAFFL